MLIHLHELSMAAELEENDNCWALAGFWVQEEMSLRGQSMRCKYGTGSEIGGVMDASVLYPAEWSLKMVRVPRIMLWAFYII